MDASEAGRELQQLAKRKLQNAYSKGYAAGSRGVWPDHKPPNPPQEQVLALFVAAKDLADAAHDVLTLIIPDEPISMELERQVKAVDAVFAEISRWLKEAPNAELSGPRPLAAEGSRSNDGLCGADLEE